MKDQEHWKNMLGGDMDALEYLYRSYIQDLFDYGMQITQDQTLTEDCIQELFTDIWSKRKNLSATKHVKPYLLLSFKRRLFRHQKKQAKETSFDSNQNSGFQIEPDAEQTLIDQENYHEKISKLKNIMALLSDQQREILYLKFEQNLTNQEIADLLNMKNQSIRNSLHRIMKKMRDHLLWLSFLSTMSTI